jgi:hypothetical protein
VQERALVKEIRIGHFENLFVRIFETQNVAGGGGEKE